MKNIDKHIDRIADIICAKDLGITSEDIVCMDCPFYEEIEGDCDCFYNKKKWLLQEDEQEVQEMQGKKITKQQFDQVKLLLSKGITCKEIYDAKLVDLSLTSLNKIMNMNEYDEKPKKNETLFSKDEIMPIIHKANMYDVLVDIIFNKATLDRNDSNELFIPYWDIRDFIKMTNRDRYICKVGELNKGDY